MSSRHSRTTVTSSRSRSAQGPSQPPKSRQYPAELITYKLGDDMVYVEPPKDYDQALDFAVRVFPDLASISRTRIAFQVAVRIGGNESFSKVRIAPMAWARAMKSLATYEIVDVIILPEPTPTQRATRSETDLSTTSATPTYLTGSDDVPPKYSISARPGAAGAGETEKSTNVRASSSSQLSAPQLRRSASPFGWLTRRF